MRPAHFQCAESCFLDLRGAGSNNFHYYTLFLIEGQGASAASVQVKTARSCHLPNSPDPSKTQSTVGRVLSIYTGPRQLWAEEQQWQCVNRPIGHPGLSAQSVNHRGGIGQSLGLCGSELDGNQGLV